MKLNDTYDTCVNTLGGFAGDDFEGVLTCAGLNTRKKKVPAHKNDEPEMKSAGQYTVKKTVPAHKADATKQKNGGQETAKKTAPVRKVITPEPKSTKVADRNFVEAIALIVIPQGIFAILLMAGCAMNIPAYLLMTAASLMDSAVAMMPMKRQSKKDARDARLMAHGLHAGAVVMAIINELLPIVWSTIVGAIISMVIDIALITIVVVIQEDESRLNRVARGLRK